MGVVELLILAVGASFVIGFLLGKNERERVRGYKTEDAYKRLVWRFKDLKKDMRKESPVDAHRVANILLGEATQLAALLKEEVDYDV